MKRCLVICMSVLLFVALQTCAVAAPMNELPRRPFFGCSFDSVPDSVRVQLADSTVIGAYVRTVRPESSAEAGGILPGDIVVRIADNPIADATSIGPALHGRHAGESIAVELLRVKERLLKTIVLKPFPKESADGYDVLYEDISVDDSLRRVMITKPKGAGTYPVVMLVGGIGCYSLDLAPGTPHPYNTVVREFAQKGFVTVRVEKSGMGDSQGPPCAETDFETEVRGYRAALKALASHEFMDTSRVFLLGHSMGGLIAPLLAHDYPLKGIVAIATIGTSWFEYELINQRRQLILAGADYDSVEIAAADKELALHALLVEKKPLDEILTARPDFVDELQYPCHYRYIQQVADLNGAHEWKSVDVPVLLVYGASDFVVAAEDHRYLRDLINSYHPGRATFVEVPQLDHFFYKVASQQASLENISTGPPAAPFCEDVLPILFDWVKEHSSR